MSWNVVGWINSIIGGLVYTIYGYVAAFARVLIAPVKAPLRYFRNMDTAGNERLAPHSVLFLSAVFASICVSLRNYKSIGGVSARAASGSSRFDDYSFLVIIAVAILIFIFCDIVARVTSRVAYEAGPTQSQTSTYNAVLSDRGCNHTRLRILYRLAIFFGPRYRPDRNIRGPHGYGVISGAFSQLKIAWIDKQILYSMLNPFNTDYMRAVYADGYTQAINGTVWKDAPIF